MKKLNAIQDVQRAAEAAMTAVMEYIKTAETPTAERAHEVIDEVLAVHGCESPEGHVVAGGHSSVEPHERGSGPLLPRQPIVIDIFPRSKATGYWADMTRTVCLGTPPVALQEMYNAVLAAMELAMEMVAPGVAGCDLHAAVSEHFKQAGYKTSGTGTEFRYAEGFVHALGHGVSTKIHDRPTLGPKSNDSLHTGDIITIEPGLYYQDCGGIRLEDLLLVTETGCQNLTNVTKQLPL